MSSRSQSRSEIRRRVFRGSLLGLALWLLAPAGGATEAASLKAGVFSPPRAAPGFTLRGSDGQPLELARYRGKVVILGFGFSSCTDVCPVTLATLAQAHRKLGEQAREVQVLYITVDPERDDAARLRQYLTGFDPSFLGGTGTPEQLAAVRNEYGIAASRRTAGESYAFDHSSYTYLIDRAGRLRALMPYGQSADVYVHDLKILLAQ
jgi:protein SCO1/2